jgi:3-oxoacyl-[acyl-carrier protein] reductase
MMKNRWGRIINLSSVSGVMGNPGQANYAASKGGVISLTKTVAKEFASRNITCNAIAPGFIKTVLTDQMTEKAREAMLGMIPLGRFGQPEDIMGAIAFLASDEASYITGQVIQIDGGMAM